MAKPIQATPVLTGPDADAVLRELESGTPKTAAREAMFRLMQQVQPKHLDIMSRDFKAVAVIQAGD